MKQGEQERQPNNRRGLEKSDADANFGQSPVEAGEFADIFPPGLKPNQGDDSGHRRSERDQAQDEKPDDFPAQSRGGHLMGGGMRKFRGIEWASGLEDGAATTAAKGGGHDHGMANRAGFGFLAPIGNWDFQAGASFRGRDLLTTIDRATAVFCPAIRMVTCLAARAGGCGLFLRDCGLAYRAQTCGRRSRADRHFG